MIYTLSYQSCFQGMEIPVPILARGFALQPVLSHDFLPIRLQQQHQYFKLQTAKLLKGPKRSKINVKPHRPWYMTTHGPKKSIMNLTPVRGAKKTRSRSRIQEPTHPNPAPCPLPRWWCSPGVWRNNPPGWLQWRWLDDGRWLHLMFWPHLFTSPSVLRMHLMPTLLYVNRFQWSSTRNECHWSRLQNRPHHPDLGCFEVSINGPLIRRCPMSDHQVPSILTPLTSISKEYILYISPFKTPSKKGFSWGWLGQMETWMGNKKDPPLFKWSKRSINTGSSSKAHMDWRFWRLA